MVQKFRRLGWEGPIEGSNHAFMKKGSRKVRIPNPHGSDEVHVSLLKQILKQAGISETQWMSAVK